MSSDHRRSAFCLFVVVCLQTCRTIIWLNNSKSVQFNMVYMRSENPYALHPVSQKFPQHCLWNGSNVRLIDDGPLSSFQRKIVQRLLFPRLAPPGDRWCDVLGFVPAGSVSSFSALLRDASHLWGLLCLSVCLLGHVPSLRHVRGSTPTGVFEGGCRPSTQFTLGFPFHFSLFCSKLIESEQMTACVVSWGNPVEDMGDCFHLHCQAGDRDRIGCTFFVDGSCTLLDSEAPPWLVFGNWAISVHYEVLRSAVFLNEKLDLWLCFACWPFSTCFPKFSGISLGTFPTHWFTWALSAGILADWVLCLTHPRLAPSQSASLCVFHGFVEWVLGIFDGIEVCFDLIHFLSGFFLHQFEPDSYNA